MIFNRIRIVAGGLCPNTRYDFVHPYGTAQLTTDATGAIRPKDGTFDNPAVLNSAPLTPGLLQWDPNVAPAAPVGYLGDGRSLHPIVGSQYRPVAGGEPANYFKIVRATDNKVTGETKLFSVTGRVAGPVLSSLDGFNFGTIETGRNSTAQSFVISNIGNTPVSAVTTILGGTNASLFAITNNTCAATLAANANCTIRVRFSPTAAAGVGAKVATLTVGHNGLRSPVTIALNGTAIAPQTPALAVTPTTLAFGSVGLNLTSTQQIVTIRNSGTGALRLGVLAISGANPTQYNITGTTCSTTASLAAGSSCSMTVVFKPTAAGAKPATISVGATDAVTADGHVAVLIPSVNVGLTGTGASSAITLSASTAAIRTAAGTTGTARVTITNSGTLPLSVTGVTKSRVDARWNATFTGCAAVAAGRNCTMNITWNLGNVAGAAAIPAVNGTSTMGFTLVSNASNKPVVNATGTRSR